MEDFPSLLYILHYVFYWDISKNGVNFHCSKSIAWEWHGDIPPSLHFMDKGRHVEIKCLLGNLFLGLHDTAFPGSPSASLFVPSFFCWLPSTCPKNGCHPKPCPWPYTVLLPSYRFRSSAVPLIRRTLKYSSLILSSHLRDRTKFLIYP